MQELARSQNELMLNKSIPADSGAAPEINLEVRWWTPRRQWLLATSWSQGLTAGGMGQETKIRNWFCGGQSRKGSDAKGKVGD